jgi:hypothetical protein
MPNDTTGPAPPVNHVFIDYENVREIDPAIIGSKTVHFTLLLGAQKTKLDAALVEKLLEHAATVELIRLQSSGRNALDFTLVYYLGRAVLADPRGCFHIVSKDAGFDPLIEHLHSKRVRAWRHVDFSALTFSAGPKPAVPATPPPAQSVKPPPKTKAPAPRMEDLEARVLEHLRKPTSARPATYKRLVSFLIAFLGNRHSEAEAAHFIEFLGQAGHLVVSDKGAISYHL